MDYVVGWTTRELLLNCHQEPEIYLFYKASRLPQKPTLLAMQWFPGAPSGSKVARA